MTSSRCLCRCFNMTCEVKIALLQLMFTINPAAMQKSLHLRYQSVINYPLHFVTILIRSEVLSIERIKIGKSQKNLSHGFRGICKLGFPIFFGHRKNSGPRLSYLHFYGHRPGSRRKFGTNPYGGCIEIQHSSCDPMSFPWKSYKARTVSVQRLYDFLPQFPLKKIVRLLSNQRMSPVELPYGDSAIHSTTCIRANDV